MGLLKAFGRGLLYLIFLPFIIVVVVFAAIVMIIVFLYQGIKNIILFFTGETIFKDTEEDKQAKAIIDMNKNLAQNLVAGTAGGSQTVNNNTTNTTNTTVNNIFVVGDNVDLLDILKKQQELESQPKEYIENGEDAPRLEQAKLTSIKMNDPRQIETKDQNEGENNDR
ncbi:MAG: hypothetical protein LUC31_01385 [Coprobacillus sp.]|nr:hypothetical protein [Coprobacillus sp.]